MSASNMTYPAHIIAQAREMEAQRLFTGDLEGEFTVPLSDGTEYLVTVARIDAAAIARSEP